MCLALLRLFACQDTVDQEADDQQGCDDDHRIDGPQGHVILDLVVQLVTPLFSSFIAYFFTMYFRTSMDTARMMIRPRMMYWM